MMCGHSYDLAGRWVLLVTGRGCVVADSDGALVGGVSVAAAIGALRAELMQAVWAGQFAYELNGQPRVLRFKPAPIEVTLQVAVTSAGKGSAGVKWWLIEAGGELSRQKVATQTVKLVLDPVMFDAGGRQVEVLVDTADTAQTTTGGGEELLDAAD
jgi:Trypsin-co-occurring domain 2